jgi:hypothetical protein
MHYSSPLSIKIFAATIAAALFLYDGSSFTRLCRQRRKCHSSASFTHCRRVYASTVAVLVFPAVYLRILRAKIRKSVALPVFPAAHFGDNFAICATT